MAWKRHGRRSTNPRVSFFTNIAAPLDAAFQMNTFSRCSGKTSAVHLEEFSRLESSGAALRLRVSERRYKLAVRRLSGAHRFRKPGPRRAPASGRLPFTPQCESPRRNCGLRSPSPAARAEISGMHLSKCPHPPAVSTFFRLTLSDLPSHSRRRCLHVSNRPRVEPPDRAAPYHPSRFRTSTCRTCRARANLRHGRVCRAPEGRQKALGSPEPHAAREFRNADLAWLIHRQILLEKIDVLQLEYMVMGQYAGRFRLIPSVLFEHDVYFQSIARRLPYILGLGDLGQRRVGVSPIFALRTTAAREAGSHPGLQPRESRISRIVPAFSSRTHRRRISRRRRHLALQLSSRGTRTVHHALSRQLSTFAESGSADLVRQARPLPLVRAEEPRSRLIVIGSDPPSRHILAETDAIELAGFVEDVREPLGRYAVFVCPILAGSGVRVKLLEAFAAGIPVVSTRIGAEGLADKDGDLCALADAPAAFAQRTLELFRDPVKGRGDGGTGTCGRGCTSRHAAHDGKPRHLLPRPGPQNARRPRMITYP